MKKLFVIILVFVAVGISAQKNYRVTKLKFNSDVYSEMAPVIYKGGIVFSSDVSNSVVSVTGPNNRNHYNLYYAEKKDASGKKWDKPKPFSKSIKSPLHESSVSFSADEKIMYFTQSNNAYLSKTELQKLEGGNPGIMQASFTGKDWLVTRKFPFSDEDYLYMYPSLTADGNKLYFCSNMPGGYGGLDIYVSEKKAGKWQHPQNMGPIINTEENEVTPFYHENGRLYFSSRGHHDRNDLDIFYTEIIDGDWINPVPLPRDFNRRNSDQFGYVMSAKMDTGYFVSDRYGTDDVFMFASSFPAFDECPDQVDETFCYKFEETSVSLEDLDTVSFKYEWDFGDGHKQRSLIARHCYEKPGTYNVSLNVIDGVTGDVYFSQASYQQLVEPVEQAYITAPDTAYIDEVISLDGSQSTIRSFEKVNYYWDMGDGNIQNGNEIEFTYTRTGTYYLRLGITDGSEEDDDEKNVDYSKRACSQRQIVIKRKTEQ